MGNPLTPGQRHGYAQAKRANLDHPGHQVESIPLTGEMNEDRELRTWRAATGPVRIRCRALIISMGPRRSLSRRRWFRGPWSQASARGTNPNPAVCFLTYSDPRGSRLPVTERSLTTRTSSDPHNRRLNLTGSSSAIATQLATLPIISLASGFTFSFDKSAGVFVRSHHQLRSGIHRADPETIGKAQRHSSHQLASDSRFSFLDDGINLHNIPAVFTHIQGTGTAGAFQRAVRSGRDSNSKCLSLNIKDQTVLFRIGRLDQPPGRFHRRADLLPFNFDASILRRDYRVRVSGAAFCPCA